MRSADYFDGPVARVSLSYTRRNAALRWPVAGVPERVDIEVELPVDRLAPALGVKHMHRLLMGGLAQRIDRQRLRAMGERGGIILAFAMDAAASRCTLKYISRSQ